MHSLVKIVVTVPETHADVVRQAIGDAGGGRIGNYTHCSFSSKGTGRFLPTAGANPHLGAVGVPEAVPEERIEATCERTRLPAVVAAIKSVHPPTRKSPWIYML